jgi:sigma-B regulation protein RsbU (phosphoserine phosphatase)
MGDIPGLSEEYTSALLGHIKGGGEAGLEHAYEIGRRALVSGLGVLDVVQMYRTAAQSWIAKAGPFSGGGAATAHAFLAESLAPFELTHRGFRETIERLEALNEDLENEVAERTASLREAHDYLERLYESASAPIVVWDVDGKITQFNPAFETFTGLAADRVIGQPVRSLFPGPSRRRVMTRIESASSHADPLPMEVPIRCSDRSVRYVLWNAANVYGADGVTLVATIAQGLDITERKAADDALHAAYEAEHRIAETLQHALLSMPERIPGITFAHAYHSATETAAVGGDFYDLFELEGGLLGLTVGDISGKGLDAAAMMSLVKNTIRAQATDVGRTPADVIRFTNHVLFAESSSETFATVFFGMLDRKSGRLLYCNAGHTVGVLVKRGRMMRLESTSTLVGAFARARFSNAEVHLKPAELLFLYTDGLTEARRDKELFGEDRVLELLGKASAPCDPDATVRRVLKEAVAFTGGKLSDDLAILALCREGAKA